MHNGEVEKFGQDFSTLISSQYFQKTSQKPKYTLIFKAHILLEKIIKKTFGGMYACQDWSKKNLLPKDVFF